MSGVLCAICNDAGCGFCPEGTEELVFGGIHDTLMGEHDPNKALHYSEGKSGVDQIPPELILKWGEVFSYGEQKYHRDNWRQGNKWHEFYGSAMRHLLAFWEGEDIDPESGLPHLSHLLWNAGTLEYFRAHNLGTDDRPIQEESDEPETE